MAKAKNWMSSTIGPLYTMGGNANQTPKIVKGRNSKNNNKKITKEKQLEMDTAMRMNNDSTTAKYHGWSVKGYKHFNELYDAISCERVSSIGKEFVENFLGLVWSTMKRKNRNKQQI